MFDGNTHTNTTTFSVVHSSSLFVFLFYVVLGSSTSKFACLWPRNPSSVYDQSTSISTVWFALL